MQKLFLFITSILLLASACRKPNVDSSNTIIGAELTDQDTLPAGFNYRNSNDVDFAIQLNAPDGNPISGIPVKINVVDNDTLMPLFSIITDGSGLAEGTYNIPSWVTELIISPNYVGVPNNVVVPVTGNTVSMNITGAKIEGGNNYSTWTNAMAQAPPAHYVKTRTQLRYKYLSPYNSLGVPSVMASNGLVTSQMLNFINSSVPEFQPVPIYHPNYLQQNLNTDVDIVQTSEVWLTFVHEGAGYKNSLGFYKYPTNNPPTSVSQIDTVYVVFPNASYYNSGGGLHSGNRVSIGTFQPGTSIGFVCISNGWTGSSVGDGYSRLFSDKNLNSQTNPALKQQSIMLFDNSNQQYYVCFEDIQRDQASCDNDFNDLVFYAKANPVTAISNANVPVVDNGIDTDGDGVSDLFDAFPTNPAFAYKNIYPSPQTFGTLAFEDLWPAKGDYDFNDLVVGYQFEQWANAQNKVKEMKCRFTINAIGAHYSHGFGFQLKSSPSSVSKVLGSQLVNNLISLSANGTEAGQSKATIIAFDNDYSLVGRPSGNTMNTENGKAFQKPDTMSMNITFSNPISNSDLGTAPFNPFIFTGGNRGKEVHLAGYQPTSLVNSSYFRTLQDNTRPSQNIYYKTVTNMPFAIDFPDNFVHLKEKNSIHLGYLKFIPWAQSSGSLFSDWYKDLNGYQDQSKLYIR